MAIKVSVLDVSSHECNVMELLPDSTTDAFLPHGGDVIMRCHGRVVVCGITLSEAGISDGDTVELISGLI